MRTESGQQRSRRGLSRSKVSSLNAQHSVLVFALCALLLALCSYAEAQSKIPHVGILFIGGRDQPHLEEFKQGLRERGYSEGKNIVLEYRRSEEHTSELQSRSDLVCRLLLEKKNK